MPLLGLLMSGLFAGLAEFFVQFFTKEIATRLAFGVLFVGGFAVLLTSVSVLTVGIAYVMPTGLATAFATAFPANTDVCISAAVTCDSLCAGYKLYLLGAGK